MEAMVVIAIIGVSAVLAAPALIDAMANRRATQATESLVRLGAVARMEAMTYGRAHLIRYTDTSTGVSPNGSVTVWRGQSNLCAANNWTAIVVGACEGNPSCIDELDMAWFGQSTNQVRMRLPGATTADLCYQPEGELFVRTGGVFGTTPPSGTEGVRFTFRRITAGAPSGVERAVIFPFGGVPRTQR
jgi:Tfp pilus assembly protein FimT